MLDWVEMPEPLRALTAVFAGQGSTRSDRTVQRTTFPFSIIAYSGILGNLSVGMLAFLLLLPMRAAQRRDRLLNEDFNFSLRGWILDFLRGDPGRSVDIRGLRLFPELCK